MLKKNLSLNFSSLVLVLFYSFIVSIVKFIYSERPLKFDKIWQNLQILFEISAEFRDFVIFLAFEEKRNFKNKIRNVKNPNLLICLGEKRWSLQERKKNLSIIFSRLKVNHGKKSHYVLSTVGEVDSTCFNLLRIPMIIEPD